LRDVKQKKCRTKTALFALEARHFATLGSFLSHGRGTMQTNSLRAFEKATETVLQLLESPPVDSGIVAYLYFLKEFLECLLLFHERDLPTLDPGCNIGCVMFVRYPQGHLNEIYLELKQTERGI
jgi:hypothetical protein